MEFVIPIIVLLIVVLLALNINIVPQSKAYVLERLGAYKETWQTGVHFKIPLIDRVAKMVSLKEQVVDFPPQPVITKDNVTMQIDTVVFYKVFDSNLFTYGVTNAVAALENLTATTLRNIVGELELDETLTSRDTVNTKMRSILDDATDPWGIKINRVELKNIDPPQAIREAMEKQMRAERERREAILLAEGEKRSNILRAEGEKEAAILRAEAQKAALIAEAEGKADAIQRINNANPTQAYLTLEGYEALKVLANGNASKLIVPSNLTDVASLVASVAETIGYAKEPAKAKKEEKVKEEPKKTVVKKK